MRTVVGLVLFLASGPALSAAATSERAEVFPSLRKRLHMQQQKQQQQLAQPDDKVDDTDDDDVPAVPDVPVAAQSSQQPLSIPAPANVGADGFPKLPAVDAMLNGATSTMKSISSQASTLQAQVMQVQAASQARMAQQKAIFERKLKMQEAKNRAVVDENGKIAAEIQTLKKGNEAFRKRCHELQEGNRVMRVELHTLQTKFGEAKDFVGASLTATDDSKAKELAVLKVPAHHHHAFLDRNQDEDDHHEEDNDDKDVKDDDEDDEKDDKDDEEDEGESFLALSSQAHRMFTETEDMEELPDADQAPALPSPSADPTGLVDILKQGVAALKEQEHTSEKKMKAIFVANFQQGTKRHAALMQQQKALNGTRAQLETLQMNLHTAEEHLLGTRTNLQERLRGLGLFAQRLAHLSLAPEGEVNRLLTALPANVEPAAVPSAPRDSPAGQ